MAILQGGCLDREAEARSTSVYLPDRRLDMLPRLLSEHLCSLNSNVDRLSVSVMWTLDMTLNLQVNCTWHEPTTGMHALGRLWSWAQVDGLCIGWILACCASRKVISSSQHTLSDVIQDRVIGGLLGEDTAINIVGTETRRDCIEVSGMQL